MPVKSFCILFLAFTAINIQESYGVILNITNGIVTSAFTAFYEDGRISCDLIPTLAQRYKDNGIENVLILSYSGEGPSLNLEDMKILLREWLNAGEPLRLKFIVQVGGLPLYDAVKLAEYCNELKVAGILVLPVDTYKGNLDEVINDLQIISNAAPDLSMLYEDLSFVSTPDVSAAEVFAAASKQICNFAGILTSLDRALQIKSSQSLQDKTVLITRHDEIAATFATNFNASVSSAGNLFPKLVLAIEKAYRNCNYKEGQAKQAELNRHFEAFVNLNNTVIDFTARSYIQNEKEAYRLITGDDLGIRIPLVRPTPAEIQQMAANLQSLGVELKGYPYRKSRRKTKTGVGILK